LINILTRKIETFLPYAAKYIKLLLLTAKTRKGEKTKSVTTVFYFAFSFFLFFVVKKVELIVLFNCNRE